MASRNATTEGHVPTRQVNSVLQNLRGEHFRRMQNILGRSASSSALSSHVHNQPTLPSDLIYPSQAPEIDLNFPWAPGPNPPRSWRSPTKSKPLSILWPIDVGDETDENTPEWRECALSLLFTADAAVAGASSSSTSEPVRLGARSRLIYPHTDIVPPLTLLCLQRVRATCTGTDLSRVASHIPPHLRQVLLRYAAVHAPLSQIEVDALCQGTTHVDTELIVVEPYNALREDFFRKKVDPRDEDRANDKASRQELPDSDKESTQWDAPQTEDEGALRSLAILQSPLKHATMLTFPPTITHLALIDLYSPVPLPRLPSVCPLLVFLDLSYNKWLYVFRPGGEEMGVTKVKWKELRKLEVLGLRGCWVDRELLIKVNKGRWEEVKIIQ